VVSISEVTGIESGVIQTQEIFSWNQRTACFVTSGVIPNLIERLLLRGVSADLNRIMGFDEEPL
jgi:hypothetical protein